MLSRRLVWGGLAAGPFFAARAAQADACKVSTRESQASLSPQQVLDRLKAGNERFVSDKRVACDLHAQLKLLSHGQAPYAAILGCIDSRAAPELVFDEHLGDIFVARVAGNIVNGDVVGSLEYATAVAGARLIVVLGHSNCGAVKGAVDDVRMGSITAMLEPIKPSVAAQPASLGERSSHNHALVESVAHANVLRSRDQLAQRSPILRDLVEQKKLMIVAAMLDLETGRVVFLP